MATLYYFCLENSKDSGAWWATVHWVAESDTTEWLLLSYTKLNHFPVQQKLTAATATAKSLQSCPTLCDLIDGSPPGSCLWDSPGKNNRVLPFPSPGVIPNPGIKLRSPALQADYLWATREAHIKFPVMHRTLLFIHSMFNNLHLLIRNSQFIPPSSHLPLGNHKSVLCYQAVYFSTTWFGAYPHI